MNSKINPKTLFKRIICFVMTFMLAFTPLGGLVPRVLADGPASGDIIVFLMADEIEDVPVNPEEDEDIPLVNVAVRLYKVSSGGVDEQYKGNAYEEKQSGKGGLAIFTGVDISEDGSTYQVRIYDGALTSANPAYAGITGIDGFIYNDAKGYFYKTVTPDPNPDPIDVKNDVGDDPANFLITNAYFAGREVSATFNSGMSEQITFELNIKNSVYGKLNQAVYIADLSAFKEYIVDVIALNGNDDADYNPATGELTITITNGINPFNAGLITRNFDIKLANGTIPNNTSLDPINFTLEKAENILSNTTFYIANQPINQDFKITVTAGEDWEISKKVEKVEEDEDENEINITYIITAESSKTDTDSGRLYFDPAAGSFTITDTISNYKSLDNDPPDDKDGLPNVKSVKLGSEFLYDKDDTTKTGATVNTANNEIIITKYYDKAIVNVYEVVVAFPYDSYIKEQIADPAYPKHEIHNDVKLEYKLIGEDSVTKNAEQNKKEIGGVTGTKLPGSLTVSTRFYIDDVQIPWSEVGGLDATPPTYALVKNPLLPATGDNLAQSLVDIGGVSTFIPVLAQEYNPLATDGAITFTGVYPGDYYLVEVTNTNYTNVSKTSLKTDSSWNINNTEEIKFDQITNFIPVTIPESTSADPVYIVNRSETLGILRFNLYVENANGGHTATNSVRFSVGENVPFTLVNIDDSKTKTYSSTSIDGIVEFRQVEADEYYLVENLTGLYPAMKYHAPGSKHLIINIENDKRKDLTDLNGKFEDIDESAKVIVMNGDLYNYSTLGAMKLYKFYCDIDGKREYERSGSGIGSFDYSKNFEGATFKIYIRNPEEEFDIGPVQSLPYA